MLAVTTGEKFCRFDFPQKICKEANVPHFYAERIKRGIRWRLYLPGTDELMNTINTELSESQRSNVDFKPLIDHFSSVEYARSSPCARPQERPYARWARIVSITVSYP